jgi:hypothetical protein
VAVFAPVATGSSRTKARDFTKRHFMMSNLSARGIQGNGILLRGNGYNSDVRN